MYCMFFKNSVLLLGHDDLLCLCVLVQFSLSISEKTVKKKTLGL